MIVPIHRAEAIAPSTAEPPFSMMSEPILEHTGFSEATAAFTCEVCNLVNEVEMLKGDKTFEVNMRNPAIV